MSFRGISILLIYSCWCSAPPAGMMLPCNGSLRHELRVASGKYACTAGIWTLCVCVTVFIYSFLSSLFLMTDNVFADNGQTGFFRHRLLIIFIFNFFIIFFCGVEELGRWTTLPWLWRHAREAWLLLLRVSEVSLSYWQAHQALWAEMTQSHARAIRSFRCPRLSGTTGRWVRRVGWGGMAGWR